MPFSQHAIEATAARVAAVAFEEISVGVSHILGGRSSIPVRHSCWRRLLAKVMLSLQPICLRRNQADIDSS